VYIIPYILYFVGVVVDDANGCEVHGVGRHTHSAIQSEPGRKSTTECGCQMDITLIEIFIPSKIGHQKREGSETVKS
jgi:hypothetical protein